MLKKIITISIIVIFSMQSYSQLTVDTFNYYHEELVRDMFISGCIEAFNIQYTGEIGQRGLFTAVPPGFPFQTGVLLTTGKATNASGPEDDPGDVNCVDYGNSGDGDLDQIAYSSTVDAAILEFDFVTSVDSIELRYLFSSEEYGELVCSDSTDVFGIFLSGPGITGPYSNNAVNLALVPGTTLPVNSSTINDGVAGTCVSCSNCLSLTNTGLMGAPDVTQLQFDGLTVPLIATHPVSPCQTYHMKIAIADGGDGCYDSGVFFDKRSMGEPTTPTGFNYSTYGYALEEVYEGCDFMYVFHRPESEPLTTQYTFDIFLSGTAVNGVDFSTFPTTITMDPNEATDTIFYTPFIDNIAENEYFIINLVDACLPCIMTPIRDTIWILDNYTLVADIIEADTNICSVIPTNYTLHAGFTQGIDPAIVSFNWSTGSQSSVVTVLPSLGTQTSYYLTITDACGQISYDTMTFTISDLAGINISTSDLLCFEECIGSVTASPIDGFGPFYYTLDSVQYSSNTINNLCAGNYIIYATDTLNCTDSATFTLNQPTEVVTNFATYNASCYGYSDGEATITAAGGISPYTFTWNTGQQNVHLIHDSLVNITAGSYSVTISDANGCSNVENGSIDEPEPFELSTTPDHYICLGMNTTLVVSGSGGTSPYFYNWDGGFSGGSYNVIPGETSTYCVTALDLNSCSSDTTCVTVHIYPEISVALSTPDDSICKGGSTDIYIESIAGGTGGPYEVHFLDGVHDEILQPPFFVEPEVTTTYAVQVSDHCGSPQGVDDITIFVSDPPEIDVFATNSEGCSPLEVQFHDLFYVEGKTYEWDFGDAYLDLEYDKPAPKHTYINEGDYTIEVEVTSPLGCKNTIEVEDIVTVYPIPEARFRADPEIASILKPIIYFENLSNDMSISYWDFGDGADTLVNTINPERTFTEPGIYTITLTVESKEGCLDEVTHTIEITEQYTFYTPNSFSPHSVVEENRTFMPKFVGLDPDEFHMIIYDRWGSKIFETFDIYHPWDGRQYNQDIEQTASYNWVVIYKDKNGGEHRKTGIVTVIF